MSVKSRERHLASIGKQTTKGWCDHCLATLALAPQWRVFDYLMDAYWETESHRENRQEFIDALEILARALKSSGERYDYLRGLEREAETGIPEEEWLVLKEWLELKGESIG